MREAEKSCYSPRQQELIRLLRNNGLKRLNLLEGSVRSGKTYISLAVWALWVASRPAEGRYLMAGRTLAALERNVLEPLMGMVGPEHFAYSLASKKGKLFERKIFLEGGGDARSQEKIRGLTLAGAYCDEVTLLDRNFFAMLLSRLSQPGAKLLATTNPDSPRHWLMEDYLSREQELDLLRMTFRLEDNPALDSQYVRELKREYTGVFYRRYILGEWVAAQGAVYRSFADDPQRWLTDLSTPGQRGALAENTEFIAIGVDFGGSRSMTTFAATAIHRGFRGLTVLADHCVRGEKGEIDGQRVNREFIAFVQKVEGICPGREVRYCFADCEAQYLINGLRRACAAAGLRIKVGDCAKVPIFQRICCTNTLLNADRLQLNKECSLLRRGLEEAVWDPSREGDVRLDNFTSDIDILDAFEYSFERFIRQLAGGQENQKGGAI